MKTVWLILTARPMRSVNLWVSTALPTVYGSFGTTLSWKGINFGLLFTYSLGGKTYNGNYANLMSLNAQSPGASTKTFSMLGTALQRNC